MIRAATSADVPAMMAMGRRFHEATPWSQVASWDDASFGVTLRGLLDGRARGALLVAGDKPIAMAAFLLLPVYFNFAVTLAQEVFWFAEPEHRAGAGLALLDEMETQARAAGASVFIMSSLAGNRDAALARLYAARGYVATENLFVKGLRP